jgi:hypothetical protein
MSRGTQIYTSGNGTLTMHHHYFFLNKFTVIPFFFDQAAIQYISHSNMFNSVAQSEIMI